MRRLTVLVLVLALGLPGISLAQQQADPEPPIDPTKLGVSLDRIQEKLDGQASSGAEDRSTSPLRLDFRVNVLGRAPQIDIFQGFDLENGPVPYGAPTHGDMLGMLTPQMFRSPVVPLSTITWWAGREVYRKVQEHNCAKEMERYRERIETGLNALVPLCAQQ